MKDGRLSDALYQGNLTDKKALSVVKKILKGDENFSSITGDKVKTDLMVPLMQDFANSKGRNIVSFEGNDFYGAQEYVVSDVKKLTNLNDIWSKTEKAKSQLSDVWNKVNSSKKTAPVKSFEDLVQRGTEYQPEFKNSVKGIADNLGFDVKVGNVKELQTLKDKALRPEEKGMFTPQSAKDVNRATIIVDSADDLARVQKEVANVYEITRVKNKFGDEYLYRSAILNVKTPLGHEAEIAVTTPKMWEAKITKGDALYKVVRAGAKGWEEAQRKMEELYKNAI